jgi:hypothetical protein
MTLPSVLFGLLVSTLAGAAFHLWKGGGLGRLILYILLSWIGFWAGHILGDQMSVSFWNLGPLHLGTALLGNFIFLFGGYWLSLIKPLKAT